jgi:hypothetical protein
MITRIFLTTIGLHNWTVPDDWNDYNNTIEVIGGGAGARNFQGDSDGGGGAAYSKISNKALTPGVSIPYSIGDGGRGDDDESGPLATDGGDTWFGNASYASAYVAAKGGVAGTRVAGDVGGHGGIGGAASAGIGDVKYSGGDALGDDGFNGGVGGGAGGPNGNGKVGVYSDGQNQKGGDGDNGYGGVGGNVYQNGGAGTEWDGTHGSGGGAGNGSYPESLNYIYCKGGLYGGGGGANDYGTPYPSGGAGAQGIIVITYFPVIPFTSDGIIEYPFKLFNNDAIVSQYLYKSFKSDGMIINQPNTLVIFNGLNLNVYTFIVERTDHESYPERHNNSFQIARRDGEKFISSYFGRKEITVSGFIQSDGQENFENEVDFFKQKLSAQQANLDITWGGGFRRYIATIESLEINRDSFNIDWCPYTAKFLIPDGKGYDLTPTVFNYPVAVNPVPGSVYSDIFVNEGTAEAFPVFTFTVNSQSGMTSFQFWNGLGQILEIDRTFSDADVITIDFLNRIIKVNGVAVNFLGSFPQYPVGSNYFNIQCNVGASSNISISSSYTKAYL